MKLKPTFSLPELEFSSVFGLFERCSPFAIFRAVGSVVINSLNAVARWAFRFWSHVSKKVLKRGPTGANGYTAPTIVRVGLRSFMQATFTHSKPRMIFRRASLSSACCAMNRATFPNGCSASLTSAGNSVPAGDTFNHDFFFGSAMAAVNSKKPLSRLGFANSFGVCLTDLFKHDLTIAQMDAGTQPLMGAGV